MVLVLAMDNQETIHGYFMGHLLQVPIDGIITLMIETIIFNVKLRVTTMQDSNLQLLLCSTENLVEEEYSFVRSNSFIWRTWP